MHASHAQTYCCDLIGGSSPARRIARISPLQRTKHSRRCLLRRTPKAQKTSDEITFSDKQKEQTLVFDADAVPVVNHKLGIVDTHTIKTAHPATQNTDVVVIGSGIGGLSCAALLAKYGLKVHPLLAAGLSILFNSLLTASMSSHDRTACPNS